MMLPISPLAGFFSIPARAYEHFTLTHAAAGTLTTIILAICAGIILAALYNFYIRQVPGGVVRLLLSRGALSPETALCAEDLGLLDHPFALWELLRGVSLRHIVCAVSDADTEAQAGEAEDAPAKLTAPEESEASTASDTEKEDEEADARTRFYIPEEKKYRAEVRFAQKGNGPMGLAVTCALTAVLGILLLKLIPVVLAMVDNFM